MKRYLRTSMKLSKETADAWRLAGFERVPFFAVGASANDMWCQRLEADSLVLNYGCSKPLYGHEGLTLNQHSHIERTRVEELPKYVGEFMPIHHIDRNAPVIVKTNGRKGRGKLVVADGRCFGTLGSNNSFRGRADSADDRGSPVVVQRFLHPAREFRVVTWDIPRCRRNDSSVGDESPYLLEPEVLAWSEKCLDDPMNPACYKEFRYRPTYDLPLALRVLLLEAHRRLGLNFVGWDVLLPEDKSGYWIIEANSAPGIGNETGKRLRKRLRKLFPPVPVDEELAA